MGKPALANPAPRRVLRDTGADTVRGIVMVNICYFLLTVGDIATMWALPVTGVAGAMVGRGVFGGASVAGLSFLPNPASPRGLRRLLPVRWGMVLFRSLVHCGATVAWYIAWDYGMPLAESYAIGYAAPLMMTLMAVPLLGEKLTKRRMMATGIGFLGMLVMLRPGGALWTPVSLVLLAGVVMMATSRTLTRVLATTETPECLTFWLLALHIPFGGAMALAGWPLQGLTLMAVAALAVLGLSNGIAHWLHSRAAALAPIGAIAPYEYTGMLWAVLLGFIFFAQVPSLGTVAGALVVVAAGLNNFYGEHRRSRDERAAAGGALAAAASAVAQRNDQ